MFFKKLKLRRVLRICYVATFLGVLIWPLFGLNLFLSSSRHTYVRNVGYQQKFAIETRIESKKKPFEHKSPLKHKTTLMSTKTCVQDYFLLILVSSAPPNIKRRRDIRQTWGVDTALKPRWKTVFLVAQSRVQNESESLLKEDEFFGDLVRADYYDHYWNQTLKVQMGFEWAARYCKFSYVLKVDDDTFVDTKALISLLNEPNTPREKLYMGKLWSHARVRRGDEDKWAIPIGEYINIEYPDYCAGFGFVLSADVLHVLVYLFDIVSSFKIDDVYVGMLANWVGVEGADHPGFKQPFSAARAVCNPDPKILVWHNVTGECLFKLYHYSF